MAKGWLVQESLYYVTEYLQTIDPLAPQLWSNNEDSKIFGEVLQGAGKVVKLSPETRDMINTFIIYNSEKMQSWLDLYEVKKGNRVRERKRA